MPIKSWSRVRRALDTKPVVAGHVAGAMPVFVERYLLQRVDVHVPPLEHITVLCQFSGGRVSEGLSSKPRMETGAAPSVLVPAGVGTYWRYAGAVDHSVVYVIDDSGDAYARLRAAVAPLRAPLSINDRLVSACALKLVDEVDRGRDADAAFLEHLTCAMMEELTRIATRSVSEGIRSESLQIGRLQAALNHARANLRTNLATQQLADAAQVSLVHFRRLFQKAMGMPPHRYLQRMRLEHASKLLAESDWPMARIAAECGFASQSHFSTAFCKRYQMTPRQYRDRERPRRVVQPPAG